MRSSREIAAFLVASAVVATATVAHSLGRPVVVGVTARITSVYVASGSTWSRPKHDPLPTMQSLLGASGSQVVPSSSVYS